MRQSALKLSYVRRKRGEGEEGQQRGGKENGRIEEKEKENGRIKEKDQENGRIEEKEKENGKIEGKKTTGELRKERKRTR